MDKPAKKKARNQSTVSSAGRCESVSSRYKKVSRLGEGTYGIVYKAIDKKSKDKRLVALKRCIPHHQSSDGFPLTTLREVQSLRLCSSHPNIVDLLSVAVSDSGVFLVMPLVGKDLAVILDDPKTPQYSNTEIKTLLQQLLGALNFCHGHHLIHRDIKPSNLLITSEGVLKVADFGLSRHIYEGQRLTLNVVSLWYRAPELLMQPTNSTYGFGIDIWSTGCVFAELLEGSPLMPGKDMHDQIGKMIRCIGQPPPDLLKVDDMLLATIKKLGPIENLWDKFADLSNEGLVLMSRMLEYDPKARLTASSALESEYFKVDPRASSK